MSMQLARQRFEALPVSRVVGTGFTILVIAFLTNAALWWTWMPTTEQLAADEGNEIGYVIYSAIYVVALVLTLRWPRALWRAVTADFFLVALLGLALASTLWSAAPDVAVRRGLALVGASVFGVYLHVRYSVAEQLRLVGWGLGLTAILSILQLGPSTLAQEAFYGIFENKNSLGRMMALATLVFGLLAWTRRPRVSTSLLGGLSLVLLLLSKSMTGLIVLLTVVSIIPFVRRLVQDMRLTVAFGSVAILVLGSVLLFGTSSLDAVTFIVGRDATLTGRTSLWHYVIEMILRRPWLGYGYETFWLGHLPFRLPVDEGAGWTAPNAHNGYLEVALALGLTGLLIFMAGLVRGAVRGLSYLRHQPGPLGLWPLLYFCFVFLYNITEIAALNRNNLLWVLYVSTMLGVSPSGSRAAHRSAQARQRAEGPSRSGLGSYAGQHEGRSSREPADGAVRPAG